MSQAHHLKGLALGYRIQLFFSKFLTEVIKIMLAKGIQFF